MSFFCDQCGREMDRRMERCPNCGAPNPYIVQNAPRTIAQLRDFAAAQGLPLDKMRVYLGVNFTEPKAYGIYRESDGMFVVYKNKADGTRAVRYHGPDEAHAVNELYQKMLQEMEQQRSIGAARPLGPGSSGPARRFVNRKRLILTALVIAVAVIIFIIVFIRTPNNGYYLVDDSYYYYQSGSWYYYDDDYDDWYYYSDSAPYDGGSYGDYYYGDTYDSTYGAGDFSSSSYYDTSGGWSDSDDSYDSYDYSDWDSGGSDWDSDW